MYKAFVVTPLGPCTVPEELYRKIVERKRSDKKFGDQIIFTLEINLSDDASYKETFGTISHLTSMADFESICLSDGGESNICPVCGRKRNILV